MLEITSKIPLLQFYTIYLSFPVILETNGLVQNTKFTNILKSFLYAIFRENRPPLDLLYVGDLFPNLDWPARAQFLSSILELSILLEGPQSPQQGNGAESSLCPALLAILAAEGDTGRS